MQSLKPQHGSSRRILIAQLAALAVALAIVLPLEAQRLVQTIRAGGGLVDWLAGFNSDTTFPLLFLLTLPLVWFVAGRLGHAPSSSRASVRLLLPPFRRGGRGGCGAPAISNVAVDPRSNPTPLLPARAGLLSLTVGLLSLAANAWVGAQFGDLPPSYHDEYAYLFQAETFLAGRTWFPSHDAPRLFDQMHILNEGRYASRYFPGTGLWIAPFLALDKPYLGHWLAGALTAVLIFWTGRELGGDAVGFLAGVLTALAPGMLLFSNVLLAHHPALVGLSLFLLGYLRWHNRGTLPPLLPAGIGLTFAMLCRPMTAAGVALPFGIHFALWLFRGHASPTRQGESTREGEAPAEPLKPNDVHGWLGSSLRAPSLARRILSAALLAGPILLGLLGNALYSRSITGSLLATPYQRYNEFYTPRQIYGFNNVERGARLQGDRTLRPVARNYDAWAENLTPRLAARNVWTRLIASLQWTLGIVPLALAAVVFAIARPGWQRGSWLLPAAILSLHLAHVPYWFAGILGYHYVFESGPLWLLILALATSALGQSWSAAGRPLLRSWWLGLIAACVLTNTITIEPFWLARLDAAVGQFRYSRGKHAEIDRLIQERVTQTPAVVLIEHDLSDYHTDYVKNHPALNAPVLRARYDPEQTTLKEAAAAFPSRYVYLLRIAPRTLHLLRPPLTADR